MKRLFALFLMLGLCLCALLSCRGSFERGAFFSEELLEGCKLADMPVAPHVDNSVYSPGGSWGNILYLNLTANEYESYVEDLIGYLRSREDIYYLGYSVRSGLVAEMLPYDEVAPITDSYDTKASDHHIFFAREDGLGGSDSLESPVELVITRKSGKIGSENFEYNTTIAICEGYLAHAVWNQCGAEHTWDEGVEYRIAGSDGTVTKYECIYCGSTTMSDFIGDMKTYKITIADTDSDHYLIDRLKEGVSGTVYTIKANKLMDADLVVRINGTRILPTEGEFDLWYYSFVMPCEDIVVTTEVDAGGPDLPAPTNHFLRNQAGCEWLGEISAEDVAELRIISEYVGVAPGNLKRIERSASQAVIARMLDEYYWLDTAPIPDEKGVICGGAAVTVRLTLKDGEKREIIINNGNYRDSDGNYFVLLYTPKFKDTDYAAKTYGYISYVGTSELYAYLDDEPRLVCEIPTDELEFVIDESGAWLFDIGCDYVVVTEFGKLYFAKDEIYASEGDEHVHVSNDYYFIEENGEGICYRLVGDGIDELIEKWGKEN